MLIICTGAQARWLGIPSEEKFKGHGVSACATCDGFFYKGKDVVVVGGGNTAVEEAIFLTNFARRVTVVHRRDHFRAEKILQQRLLKNTEDRRDLGQRRRRDPRHEDPKSVTGVRLKNAKTGKTSEIPADGVFIAIGHAPATELFKGQLEMTHSGYLKTKPELDRDCHSRRVRRRRREGRGLPSGRDRGRHGLHGRARGRALLRDAGDRARRRGGGIARTRASTQGTA